MFFYVYQRVCVLYRSDPTAQSASRISFRWLYKPVAYPGKDRKEFHTRRESFDIWKERRKLSVNSVGRIEGREVQRRCRMAEKEKGLSAALDTATDSEETESSSEEEEEEEESFEEYESGGEEAAGEADAAKADAAQVNFALNVLSVSSKHVVAKEREHIISVVVKNDVLQL